MVKLGEQGEGGGKGVVKTEGQIRAQLQAEANAAIEELLQWGRSTETPDLTQMEDKVLWLRDRLASGCCSSWWGAGGQATGRGAALS